MGLYNAIYRKLVADGTLYALIGTRIYNGLALDGTLPQLQIDVESQEDDSIEVWDSKQFTVDVKTIAASVESREAIRRQVFTLLNRQQWSDAAAGVSISSTLMTSESSFQQSISGDVERLYYTADQSFNFIAKES